MAKWSCRKEKKLSLQEYPERRPCLDSFFSFFVVCSFFDAESTFATELESFVWACRIIDPPRFAQNAGFNYFQLRVYLLRRDYTFQGLMLKIIKTRRLGGSIIRHAHTPGASSVVNVRFASRSAHFKGYACAK